MRDMGRPAKVPEDKKGFDYQFDVLIVANGLSPWISNRDRG